MVEKADGNDKGQTAKPSRLTRLFRFGQNGVPENSPAKIDKSIIGRPKLMGTTVPFFGETHSNDITKAAAAATPTASSRPTQQVAPDLQKPLPALPHDVTEMRDAVSPPEVPIKNDQAPASKASPGIGDPSGEKFETNAAEIPPAAHQKSAVGNGRRVHWFESDLPAIAEETGHVAGKTKPSLVAESPAASAENQPGKAVQKPSLVFLKGLTGKASERRGLNTRAADGAINNDQAAAPKALYSIDGADRESLKAGAARASETSSQRFEYASRILRLGQNLPDIKEEPGPLHGTSQPSLSAVRPAVLPESSGGNAVSKPTRPSQRSFLEKTQSPNAENRRLAPLLPSATKGNDDIPHKNQIPVDRPAPLVEKQSNKPASNRGLDDHRRDGGHGL